MSKWQQCWKLFSNTTAHNLREFLSLSALTSEGFIQCRWRCGSGHPSLKCWFEEVSLTVSDTFKHCVPVGVMMFWSRWWAVGVILFLLGRFTVVPNRLHLWIMALKRLRNGVVTLCRLMSVNYGFTSALKILYYRPVAWCLSFWYVHLLTQLLFKWRLCGACEIKPSFPENVAITLFWIAFVLLIIK